MGRPIEFHLGHLQIADDTGKKVRAFNEGLEKGRDDITCTERSGTIPEALLGAGEIDPTARAETLSIAQFCRLAECAATR